MLETTGPIAGPVSFVGSAVTVKGQEWERGWDRLDGRSETAVTA
jgi:hypothetical protein